MSTKIKLISCIFGIIIAFGMMIMGVFAAVQQNAAVVYVSDSVATSLPTEFSSLYAETTTDITGYKLCDVKI